MKYLTIEQPESPQGEDFVYISKAQQLQKFLAPFTDEILSEAPYACISVGENNEPILNHAILSGDLQIKIKAALKQL